MFSTSPMNSALKSMAQASSYRFGVNAKKKLLIEFREVSNHYQERFL